MESQINMRLVPLTKLSQFPNWVFSGKTPCKRLAFSIPYTASCTTSFTPNQELKFTLVRKARLTIIKLNAIKLASRILPQ